jgi:asparaginyl-tRNA synthetase
MAEADSVVAKAAELSVADVSSIQHAFSVAGRVVIQKLLQGGRAFIGQSVVVGGWVKTGRDGEKGALAFLEVNDGSCTANLQVIVPSSVFDLSILTSTGASVLLRGTVKEPPEGKKQSIEVHATEVPFAGPSDGKTYPVAKTKLSLEFLRSVIHFRIRTNTIAAISRIRNTLAAATHEFFQKNGFLYVHSPLITSSDCEGAGEMFQVSCRSSSPIFPVGPSLKESVSFLTSRFLFSSFFFFSCAHFERLPLFSTMPTKPASLPRLPPRKSQRSRPQ